MMLNLAEIDGSCHRGAVRLHVRLSDGPHTARRCTCSFCRMRGAVVASANLDGPTILGGEEALALYHFGTTTAKHRLCSKCGIYTHHQRRSKPHEYGVNVACLGGLGPFDFAAVPVLDGVHHPSDGASGGQDGVRTTNAPRPELTSGSATADLCASRNSSGTARPRGSTHPGG